MNTYWVKLITEQPLTMALLVIMVLTSISGLRKPAYFGAMLLHPASIAERREYYRLVTGDLVHNDVLHLVMNAIMLVFVCGHLETLLIHTSAYGEFSYALIFLSGMLTGNGVVTLRHRKIYGYASVGASGPILGCMFGFMVLAPNTTAFYVPGIGGIPNKYDALMFIVMLVWHQRRSDNPMINHEVHFWGALGGLAATLLLTRMM
jgi:membrane associated rhomboid family serine protease